MASSQNAREGDPGPSEARPDDGAAGAYECNICLDTAKDAVVSLCGHLFCWPCLHQWLETRPTRQLCPVCKASISRDKVIPLYGRGSTSTQDPRDKLPPRPPGQRTEGDLQQQGSARFLGDYGNGGFQVSFGLGMFPFTFFTQSFNVGGRPNQAGAGVQPQQRQTDEQFMSQLLLWLGLAFLFYCIWL